MCVHDGGQQLTEGTDKPKPENIVISFFITSIYVWSEYSLTGGGAGLTVALFLRKGFSKGLYWIHQQLRFWRERATAAT